MDTMVDQGLINTKAYSIYLNSRHSSTGSIVFGGLNTTKYHGNLIQLPVIPYANSNGTQLYQLLQVNMAGLSINNKNSTTGNIMNSNNNIIVILDTGAQVSYLPVSLISSIVANLGGIFDSNLDYDNPNPFSGVPFVDCDIRKQQPQGMFDFAFGGHEGGIKVPYDEFLLDIADIYNFPSDLALPKLPFTSICTIAALPNTDPPYVLGDSFMRSAYIVFDLKNNLVGMANTNFNSSMSRIVDFPKDMSRIPGLVSL
jgi:Eukaryotic aspartyl protease